jgi:hypothetical protein
LKVGDTVAVSDVSEADQVYALVLE